MFELYSRIWRCTGPTQILLIALSVAVAILAAVPLQYQKDVVNGLAGTMSGQDLMSLCAQ